MERLIKLELNSFFDSWKLKNEKAYHKTETIATGKKNKLLPLQFETLLAQRYMKRTTGQEIVVCWKSRLRLFCLRCRALFLNYFSKIKSLHIKVTIICDLDHIKSSFSWFLSIKTDTNYDGCSSRIFRSFQLFTHHLWPSPCYLCLLVKLVAVKSSLLTESTATRLE